MDVSIHLEHGSLDQQLKYRKVHIKLEFMQYLIQLKGSRRKGTLDYTIVRIDKAYKVKDPQPKKLGPKYSFLLF